MVLTEWRAFCRTEAEERLPAKGSRLLSDLFAGALVPDGSFREARICRVKVFFMGLGVL